MLKSWRAWLLAIFGLIVVVLILANSLSFQACMQETRDYYASEGIPYFFLKGLENCVGSYIIAKHAVITAFATAFIAWFTYTLWNANREQIKRTREIERAYISGGGPLDKIISTTLSSPSIITGRLRRLCWNMPSNSVR
jgi:TRAP-type C4-dicarboxylate transport system permease small subunit